MKHTNKLALKILYKKHTNVTKQLHVITKLTILMFFSQDKKKSS